MSTAIQTIPKTNEVEFVPFGSEDRIKLNVSIVQRFVAIKTKSGKVPDETDCIRFMMLCRSRKLNPFEGDCFLQGYDGKEGPQFSLITAHQAFLKRAEVHPEFDGMDSGVIVKDTTENLVERPGDFMEEGDELLGGWAVVYFKTRKHAMKRRLNLRTFRKPFGRWNDDPAGMIVKCAEADALRSSFPTMLGGLYSEDERPVIDIPSGAVVKTPDFAPQLTGGIAPKTSKPAEKPVSEPPKPPQTPQDAPKEPALGQDTPPAEKPAPAPASEQDDGDLAPITPKEEAPVESEPESPAPVPFKPNPKETDELQSVRLLLFQNGALEEQVMTFCRAKKMARDDQKLSDLSTAKLKTLISSWPNIVNEVKAQ